MRVRTATAPPMSGTDMPARLVRPLQASAFLIGLVSLCGTSSPPPIRAAALVLVLWPAFALAFEALASLRPERVLLLADPSVPAPARVRGARRMRIAGRFAPDAAGFEALLGAATRRPVDRVLIVGPAPDARRLARLACLGAEIVRVGAGVTAAEPGATLLAGWSQPVWRRGLKRGADLVLACLLLALCLPLMAVIAIAVATDGGPVLFAQAREGWRGAPLTVLKFRTMRPAAPSGGFEQTRPGDARVTRIGRVLRRTSLDELPQLLLVLAGRMSLVGPRPHAPGTIPVDPWAAPGLATACALRLRVRPGLSGWAQVNHSRGALSGRADIERRLALDLDYVRGWSPWLDAKIVLLTPWRLVFARGRAF